jgi:hypothetical protein
MTEMFSTLKVYTTVAAFFHTFRQTRHIIAAAAFVRRTRPQESAACRRESSLQMV